MGRVINSRIRMGVPRKTFKMGQGTKSACGLWPVAIFLCIFVSLCSSATAEAEKGGYFLFTPPFGGDTPAEEVIASKRSGGGIGGENNDITSSGRSNISPAETLWVGSHKINWNPLPVFEKFLKPNDYHQQKQEQKQQQQQFAQARKYDFQDPPKNKGSFSPFGGGDAFKGLFGLNNHHQKKSLFQNPHHDFSKKFSTGGFFEGLGNFGPKSGPQKQTSKFAEPRSSVQPERDFALPPSPFSSSQSTTPTPNQSSTGGTMLVSTPEALYALSTPGPSLSPIIDRLRQMTEWSRQGHKSTPLSLRLVKKEGKPNSYLENKQRLKKRLRASQKARKAEKFQKSPHKHNIEAIILSNDDQDRGNDSQDIEIITGKSLKFQESQQKPQTKPMKRKRKSRGRHVSKEQNRNSAEEQFRPLQQPQDDFYAIHPTNAVFSTKDPVEIQQTARKNYELKRKNKKVALFQHDNDAEANQQTPFSFRFGPEDAKVSPYSK